MSIQPNFSSFYTETQALKKGNHLPQERPAAAARITAYENKINSDPEFAEAMGINMNTRRGKLFAKLISELPADARELAGKCKVAYEKRQQVNGSLSEALDDLEKIPESKRRHYKIGLRKDGKFKLHRKGFTADCAEFFLGTRFHSLGPLFAKYRADGHADTGSHMGDLRNQLLHLVEVYDARKTGESKDATAKAMRVGAAMGII